MSTTDRDPRHTPIEGDIMQIGRTRFYVGAERWANHVGFRHRRGSRTSHHIPLWQWRRMMALPDAMIVEQAEVQS